MCYGILAKAKKDVSSLSSRKEESVLTPKKAGIGGRESASSLMSGSGFAAVSDALLASSSKVKGGISEADDIEMTSGAVTREVEEVG